MEMQLRVPVAMVEHLTAGIDDAIQKLVINVLQSVGRADVLVPPVPPMTRCPPPPPPLPRGNYASLHLDLNCARLLTIG